jgi:hypothetical protein
VHVTHESVPDIVGKVASFLCIIDGPDGKGGSLVLFRLENLLGEKILVFFAKIEWVLYPDELG